MSARIITDVSAVKPLVSGRFYNLTVDGATTISEIIADEITISNGTGSVVLSTDNSGDLNVSGVVKAPGLLFTNSITAQSELSIYNTENLDHVIPLDYLSTQCGELLCRFERVGNVVFCEARGFIDFQVGSLVSTVAIPSGYRPPHQVTFTLPLYGAAEIPAFVIGLCTLSTAGIITVTTSVPTPGGGLYYTGLNTVNYDRYTFSYRL